MEDDEKKPVQTPKKRVPLAEVLMQIPNVGRDSDFERVDDNDEPES